MKGGQRKCSIVPTLTVLSSNTELGSWVLGARGARVERSQRGMISPESGHHLLLRYFLPCCCQQAAQDLCSHLQQTPAPVPGQQTNSELLPAWTWIISTHPHLSFPHPTHLGKYWWDQDLCMLISAAKRVWKHSSVPSKMNIKHPEWESCSIL